MVMSRQIDNWSGGMISLSLNARVAAFDPEFVAGHPSGRGIGENARLDLGFVTILAEKSRAAVWTEMLTAVFSGPAGVAHPI